MTTTYDGELVHEQSYFDNAREERERRRHEVGDVALGMINPRQGVAGRKHAEQVRAALGEPDDAVAIGRMDLLDGETIYVGKHHISDAKRDVLVVNWQAPVAAPFHKATIRDALGVARKRTFMCDKNRIASFQDLLFADLLEQVEELEQAGHPRVDDALLADLDRGRTGEMQDIVRTIQAAQYELMEAPLDQILVVQGGPGTGKTVVALHRVSWLLFNHPEQLSPEDVLVVGPSKTFVRYIQQVLPTLGDEKVAQRDLAQLAPQVSLGREEPSEVQLVKGTLKMTRILDRALQDRIQDPDADLEVRTAGRTLTVPVAPLRSRLAQLRGAPYNVGRGQLRDWIRAGLQSEYGEQPSAEAIDQALNRIWPQLSAPAFLQDLLGSQDRLLRAAGEDLTGREVNLLYRQAAARLGDELWSYADLPLLDHIDAAMSGDVVQRYRHVVVDEAQDLSPMQLASLARRLTHPSMTLLGDIAQSTSAWSRDSWDDVLDQLRELTPGEAPAVVRELEFGYRVPTQVFEHAAQLLPIVAPRVTAPRVVRPGPAAPQLFHEDVDDIAVRAADQASEYAGRGYMVGVVCPGSRRDELEAALRARNIRWRDSLRDGLGAGSINLMEPETAKGLEFDAAVVAYPDDIVGDDPRIGGRLLYIAMTRCTQELSLVFSHDPFGGALGQPDSQLVAEIEDVLDDGGLWPPAQQQQSLRLEPAAEEEPASAAATAPEAAGEGTGLRPLGSPLPRFVRRLAEQLAAETREALNPEQVPQFVAELSRLLLGEGPGSVGVASSRDDPAPGGQAS